MIRTALRRSGLRQALLDLRAELRTGLRGLAGTDRAIVRRYVEAHAFRKLQLGSGDHSLPGWLNAGYRPRGRDVPHIDVRDPFPVEDGSFDYVFAEHLIEHLTRHEGAMMLRECFRVLRRGGRIRLSTPSLEAVLALGTDSPDATQRAYAEMSATRYQLGPNGTALAVILNNMMRSWGHKFVYDRSTLEAALLDAGFTQLSWHALGQSEDAELRGLENEARMPPGLLAYETMTVEAVKP
jgi:predicted SAM-dependent methyltransferase